LALELPLWHSIHGYYIDKSAKLAGGFNVVNVILVDFRGFDTLGEITVLVLAGLGVYALRRVWVLRSGESLPPEPIIGHNLPASQILRPVSAVLFPLIFFFSLFMALRGHNMPGGGFIGGLIAASGLVLELLALGNRRFFKLLPINGRFLFAIGLSLAFLTGVVPLLFGLPFLTSAVIKSIHFSTAAIFDIGVYLVVVGVTLEMIVLIERPHTVKESTA
jgi:multicomponent K+:H+ antiporter subunit A